MARFCFSLGFILLLASWAGEMRGADSDVEIHCVPKRVDQDVKQAGDGGAAVTKEHWIYEVTIENKTFKPLSDLELKYVIFSTKEHLGTKTNAASSRQNGIFECRIVTIP